MNYVTFRFEMKPNPLSRIPCCRYFHTQTYHDGMSAAGSTDHMMLSRSAWAGMSKHRAVLWNGDTSSTYAYLKTAIQAGQSVQMSGIAWWTTDIGGYGGGKPSDPMFRELIVRWFQFGFACPLFRQHGNGNLAVIWGPFSHAIWSSKLCVTPRAMCPA